MPSSDLDFVIGFIGLFILLSQVKNTLSYMIEWIGMDKITGIWNTVMSIVRQNIHLLEVNNVVTVFKEWGSSKVLARKITW